MNRAAAFCLLLLLPEFLFGQETVAPPPRNSSSLMPGALPLTTPQSIFPPVTEELPPLQLAPVPESPELPNGTSVSRPLTPVGPGQPAPPPEKPAATPDVSFGVERLEPPQPRTITRQLATQWDYFEVLSLYAKGSLLPPLAVTTRTATSAQAEILLGGGIRDSLPTGGGRFTFGRSLGEAKRVGLEFSYFFANQNEHLLDVSHTMASPMYSLARPVLLPGDSSYQLVMVGDPDSVGHFLVEESLRVRNWELNTALALIGGEQFRLSGRVGLRWANLSESLNLIQTTIALSPGRAGLYLPATVLSRDTFETRNRFFGGQLGLRAELQRGPIFLEIDGKCALGANEQSSEIQGESVMIPHQSWFPAMRLTQGVLAHPSNIGLATRSTFAVVPEAWIRLGYRYQDRLQFSLGYTFMYLSDVVRPGEQIDTTVDMAYVPSPAPVLVKQGAERPGQTLIRSDFWLQGLTFGLEIKY